MGMMLHGLTSLPFWFAMLGLATAFYLYILQPDVPGVLRQKLAFFVRILDNKYGFDDFNQWFFASGAVKVGTGLWRYGDAMLIDGVMVNGTARIVGWIAGVVRWLQSGFIYQYAFAMIIGISVLLFIWVFDVTALLANWTR